LITLRKSARIGIRKQKKQEISKDRNQKTKETGKKGQEKDKM